MKRAYQVVSVFSGCGGLDLGFKQEGFDLAYACDSDPVAVECYQRNVDSKAYVRDVREQLFREEIQAIGSADIVLGGFPCQGFSKAGPKKETDTRNLLYREMKFAVETLKPKIFIAENVDGLSQNFQGKFLEHIVSDFNEIGYNVEYKIIDAISFGVAQNRRRVLFLGIDKSISQPFAWPVPTHRERNRSGEKKYDYSLESRAESVADYLPISSVLNDLVDLQADVPDHQITNNWPEEYKNIMKHIKQGQKLCNVRHSSSSVYTWDIQEVFGYITDNQYLILDTIAKNRRHKKYGTNPNGNPLSQDTIEELTGLRHIDNDLKGLADLGYLKQDGDKFDLKGAMFASGLFKRPKWNEPSPTVLTNFHNPRFFVHPLADRPFSARECARLQGFPDDFRFSWEDFEIKLEDRYRLIGNAVAVPVSRALARAAAAFFAKLEEQGSRANMAVGVQ